MCLVVIDMSEISRANGSDVKWDTSALQDKVALLKNAANTIRTLNSTYKDLQARIEENWTGAAASVFLSELSIDVGAVDTLASNIDILAAILTRAVSVFGTCADEVSTDMQNIEEQLSSIR